MTDKIRLGISTCLLGERVRYDGQHKLDRFLTDTLGRYVTYIPVCPEYEVGLGVPREAMRLVGDPQNPRLVTQKTKIDHTDRMLAWSRRRVRELEKENLDGYIFKSKSPSSGMEAVKVYLDSGQVVKKGIGLFARVFMEHFPLLPVEDEGRLHDPALRENFIERIFVMKRWRDMLAENSTRGALVDFHTRHKLLIMAHSPKHYQQMGRLVAEMKGRALKEVQRDYIQVLIEALRIKAARGRNANVLQHLMGYFKDVLTAGEKKELIEVIDNYRHGYLPLIVPVTLIGHYVAKYDQAYLKDQFYLSPHPLELQLRNHG
ncbi:MAG: DUF523 and DUF1722 domain-containing protein [Kiritimatiellae bacterium]|nr:DUF523 and DUF1722 domain-containing protein [Kiritimatiellia bacterium]